LTLNASITSTVTVGIIVTHEQLTTIIIITIITAAMNISNGQFIQSMYQMHT
jgi:hypothetical protein